MLRRATTGECLCQVAGCLELLCSLEVGCSQRTDSSMSTLKPTVNPCTTEDSDGAFFLLGLVFCLPLPLSPSLLTKCPEGLVQNRERRVRPGSVLELPVERGLLDQSPLHTCQCRVQLVEAQLVEAPERPLTPGCAAFAKACKLARFTHDRAGRKDSSTKVS